MTYADAVKKAVAEHDPALAGRFVDRMRGLGATYEDCYQAAARHTGIGRAEWEGLMLESEEEQTT